MPQVCVVVPTFHRPAFLAEALSSVREQTLTDFEVLVCDNGNDHETADVVRALADVRFRYIARPRNLGMLRNATLGFEQANAQFVMKLDDDDQLCPDALERLVMPLVDDPELAMSFGGVTLVDDTGEPLDEMTRGLDRSSGRDWFPEGLIRPSTWLVASGGVQMAGAVLRKDVIDWTGIPDEVATAYDLFLTLAAVEGDRAVHFTRAPVVRYRLHAGADTVVNFTPQALGTCAVLERALASGAHGDCTALTRRLAEATLHAGRALTHQGETVQAREFLRRSLALHPSLTAARLLALAHAPAPAAKSLARARLKTRARRAVRTV